MIIHVSTRASLLVVFLLEIASLYHYARGTAFSITYDVESEPPQLVCEDTLGDIF